MMKFKDMVECIDKNCRTVVVSKHVDGLKCVRCGGPTRPMPFAPLEKQEEKLGAIEQTIINNKKKEIYKELVKLARLISDKKHGIKMMAGMFCCEDSSMVEDFLIDAIKTERIASDIVLPKETEQFLLKEGIEELLKKLSEVDAEKLAKEISEKMIKKAKVSGIRI
ncbi:hypothetical protein IGM_06641 [Bacillus cereus HuB4-4]|uniref:Uncharacterized protein n=1 Tax=Bacillus cereus HuB4-4 TaxID=1053211 RepID=A0A9W5QMP0_BACCE|nr:hypothetical protein [Bacillus cereus]EOP78356.1 hypothetical protein IGM_06641 [Bacillus cereus HuB4-4]